VPLRGQRLRGRGGQSLPVLQVGIQFKQRGGYACGRLPRSLPAAYGTWEVLVRFVGDQLGRFRFERALKIIFGARKQAASCKSVKGGLWPQVQSRLRKFRLAPGAVRNIALSGMSGLSNLAGRGEAGRGADSVVHGVVLTRLGQIVEVANFDNVKYGQIIVFNHTEGICGAVIARRWARMWVLLFSNSPQVISGVPITITRRMIPRGRVGFKQECADFARKYGSMGSRWRYFVQNAESTNPRIQALPTVGGTVGAGGGNMPAPILPVCRRLLRESELPIASSSLGGEKLDQSSYASRGGQRETTPRMAVVNGSISRWRSGRRTSGTSKAPRGVRHFSS